MNCYINHKFKKGYLLGEEQLIKLQDIIRKRLTENENNNLTYSIYKNDNVEYKTSELEEILKEENSIRNKIITLDISHKCNEMEFNINFDEEQGVELLIQSLYKDDAYLLFSDIKEYINTEITILKQKRINNIIDDRFISVIIGQFVFIYTLLSQLGKTNSSKIKQLISNGTVNDKLNFILSQNSHYNSINIIFFPILATSITVTCILFVSFIFKKHFPTNIFYTGKQKIIYDKLTNTRSKIFWGIIIAFIVGVITSFFVYYITK